VRVKVLDIDRDRQRISLGLKQTQEDPWQRVLDSYGPGDILEGKVTKVVAFGAFVEIVPGVEGLVHISELADHHVESPGEVASPGDEVRVKILEIDEERRRISLSIKRVEGQGLPLRDVQVPEPAPAADGPAESVPDLGLSEEVFSESPPEAPPADGAEAPAAREEAASDPEQASGEGVETPGEGSRDDE
jgi:small subunit ribosomal protein S1